jgi:hypothetical protein
MNPGMGSLWNNGTYQIARLKRMMHFLALAMPDGKALLVGAAHLASAVASGRDEQRKNPLHLHCLRGALPNAYSISPMGLFQMACHPVELGQTATATFHRQAQRL